MAFLQTTSATSEEGKTHSVQISRNKYIEIGFCKTAKSTRGENDVVDGLINNEPAKILRSTICNTILVV